MTSFVLCDCLRSFCLPISQAWVDFLLMKNNFSDPEFLKRVKSLDNAALGQLVDAYTDHLFKAGLGQGLSSEMSQDVTANTWTTFIEVVPRFEGRSHIRTFLFGIFYNKVSEIRRANFKFEKTDPIEEAVESSFKEDGHWANNWKNPEDTLESEEVMAIISNCMEHLPEIQKSAFYLKHIEQEDTDSICEILGLTNVNFRQIVFRAKNRIRNCVEKALAS